jgi:hypothetical protein
VSLGREEESSALEPAANASKGPDEAAPGDGRRRLLRDAGRLALATPPAITLLLTSGGAMPAWASGANPGNRASGANPGNNKPVGAAGEYPPGQPPGGTGDRGNAR